MTKRRLPKKKHTPRDAATGNTIQRTTCLDFNRADGPGGSDVSRFRTLGCAVARLAVSLLRVIRPGSRNGVSARSAECAKMVSSMNGRGTAPQGLVSLASPHRLVRSCACVCVCVCVGCVGLARGTWVFEALLDPNTFRRTRDGFAACPTRPYEGRLKSVSALAVLLVSSLHFSSLVFAPCPISLPSFVVTNRSIRPDRTDRQ